MLNHRGEALHIAFTKSGKKMKDFAKYMGKSERTIYNYFEVVDLSLETLEKAGKYLKHDFTNDVKYPGLEYVRELEEKYKTVQEQLGKALIATEEYRLKYEKTLTEYNESLKKKLADKKSS